MAATATSAAVEQARAKVQEYLSQFDDVEIDADGNCSLRYGSALVEVDVQTFDQDSAAVVIKAACVTGATSSPELFEHIATGGGGAEFGHLSATKESDGTITINFSHSMLSDYLNPAELRMVVIAVAYTADQLDDGLAAKFGGKVYDAGSNVS